MPSTCPWVRRAWTRPSTIPTTLPTFLQEPPWLMRLTTLKLRYTSAVSTYSHTSLNNMTPTKAKLCNCYVQSRFLMHEKAVQPFVQYFQSCDRLVSVDVSSGASEAIVDRVHQVFTSLNLQAWRPVNTVLVFAMSEPFSLYNPATYRC